MRSTLKVIAIASSIIKICTIQGSHAEMVFASRSRRVMLARLFFIAGVLVLGSDAAPFTSRAALQTAVNNCLDAVPSGGNCCSSGGTGCGAAGSTDMPDWDVSQVTSMVLLFANREEFDADISRWDVSSVSDMGEMFSYARDFNQDIPRWDISAVSDMRRMSQHHPVDEYRAFNQDITGWNVKEGVLAGCSINNLGGVRTTTSGTTVRTPRTWERTRA